MLRSFQNENKYYSYIDLGSPIDIHAHVCMCRCKRVTNEKSIYFMFAVLQAIESLHFPSKQYWKGPVSFNTLQQTNLNFIYWRLECFAALSVG